MVKRTALAILIGLCGFALGIALARVTDEGGSGAVAVEGPPPALRHSSQLRPPLAGSRPGAEGPRSGR